MTDQGQEQLIHRMDDVLASQVAAGEVVERPASVVKELVENSIDAGATQIRVEIRRGGVSLVKVSDNGSGMSPADAAMCLERHATSKLLTYENLFDIQQLGFRGEALPSIASIAELKIVTRRPRDVEGVQVSCAGGHMDPPMEAGCAPGTEISVSNLFFNTPARRKFLKSDETEAGHIEHQLRLHALAFPNIRFILVRDGQEVFDVPSTSDLRQRIGAFIGREMAARLLRIRPVIGPGIRVSGYLMPLSEAKRNRRMQYIFLNGRAIEDKTVARAVRDGYGGFPTGLHPGLFLYLEMDPGLVDVNVHPAKREVRFRRPSDMVTAVIDAVAGTLAAHARGEETEEQGLPLPPPASGKKEAPAQEEKGPAVLLRPILAPRQKDLGLPSQSSIPGQFHGTEKGESPSSVPRAVGDIPSKGDVAAEGHAGAGEQAGEEKQARRQEKTAAGQLQPSRAAGETLVQPPPVSLSGSGEGDRQGFRFVGHLSERYLMYENRDGLVLLSPRAARERIVFERLLESHRRPLPSQRLLSPVMVELDAREMGIAMELRPQLEKAGFLVSHFGKQTLRIEAVPAMLSLPRVDEFVMGVIQAFSAGEARLKRARNPFEPYAVQMARQYVLKEDMAPWFRAPMPLLIDLLRCEIPYCTPGGKPTMVPMPLNEINRRFQAH